MLRPIVGKMRTNIVPRHSCNQFSLNLKWISAAAFSQEIWLSSTEEQAR